MIFSTWHLYSLDENMKKLTEARGGKKLSGVVFINQINNPPLPWVKDSFKHSLKYVCSTTITTTTFSKKPSPPSTHLAVGKCQRQNSMCICYYGLLERFQPTLGNVRYYYVWFVIYATENY